MITVQQTIEFSRGRSGRKRMDSVRLLSIYWVPNSRRPGVFWKQGLPHDSTRQQLVQTCNPPGVPTLRETSYHMGETDRRSLITSRNP